MITRGRWKSPLRMGLTLKGNTKTVSRPRNAGLTINTVAISQEIACRLKGFLNTPLSPEYTEGPAKGLAGMLL